MRHGRAGVLPALLLATFLAGCVAMNPSSQPSSSPSRRESSAPAPRAVDRNLSGFPLAFKQGYVDGCDSGGGSRRRDESRYKSDLDYLMGWNDGYAVCRR